jgi:hypothetical protein
MFIYNSPYSQILTFDTSLSFQYIVRFLINSTKNTVIWDVRSTFLLINSCRITRRQMTKDNVLNSYRHENFICQKAYFSSASELCRPRDRGLSDKLVPTFVDRRVPRGYRNWSLRPYARLSRPEPLLFFSSSSSIVLTRLSGPSSRPTTSQKIW